MEDTKKAFILAYDEHADALFRHCFYKVHDREKAKDILQEAFMKTWAYISKGKEITNMRAFLYRTLNNLIVDEYRKKKDFSLDALEEEGFEPKSYEESTIEERIDGEKALRLINKLPHPYRDAIFMRYVNNLEIKEIAEITGEEVNTVSVHLHRGMIKLRELFI